MASAAECVAILNGINLPTGAADGDRAEIITAAKKLLQRLETPVEKHTSIGLAPYVLMAEKTLIDTGILEKWHLAGKSAKNVNELSKMSMGGAGRGADPDLLDRLLRLLAAANIVDQVAPLTYQMNKFTLGLLGDDFKDFIDFTEKVFIPTALHMPGYLASLEYQTPTDANNTCFIQTTEAKQNTHTFAWMMANPNIAKSYIGTVVTTAEQAWWVNRYPVDQILPKNTPSDEVTIVDVGGGFGEDLERFRTQFESRHGRLVLQDLPHALPLNKCKAPIETMAYDFFTPQPIIGARVYALRNVLHDWPLEKAKDILRNQVLALRSGVSKIFIHERIIPILNPSEHNMILDMIMMTLGSAIERTWPQWEELITAAGLKVVKVWPTEVPPEVIIECDVA